jgi:hypothetical protein
MMNRSRCALLFMSVVLFSIPIFSTQSLAQAKPASLNATETLAPVAWLAGGTWVTDVKDPSDGTTTHVENHIHWAPNRQAIEFIANFDGKPHYNGFYAYNPATKTIGFYYTNPEGQFSAGTATADADGKTIHQDLEINEPNGKTNHVRSTLVRDGDNAYWFSVFVQKDGEWAQLFKLHYERK